MRLNYDYVLLLNNDTIPQPDFLKNLVECAESDKGIGIVASTRINSWDPYREAGPGMDLTTGLVRYEKSPDDWKGPIQCIWTPFCSVLFSRACVEYVGLLDEKLINHCQDNDYCLRAVFMGFGIVVEPRSKVFHYQSVTIHSLNIEPYDEGLITVSLGGSFLLSSFVQPKKFYTAQEKNQRLNKIVFFHVFVGLKYVGQSN